MSDQSEVVEDFKEGMHRSLFVRVRRDFLAGIVVTAPIAITLYVTYVFLTFIDNRVAKLIPSEYYPETAIPGIGLLIAIVFFVSIGWLARNFLGRMIIGFSEYIVHRMPVINTIYKGTKQIFETIMASQSQAFRDVVMFEYPRPGIWVMGFVTGLTKGEVQRLTENEVVNVFLPTTPNPTSGFLLFVPRKDLRYMEMTVEEGVKMIISGGILTPPDREIEEVEENTAKLEKPKKKSAKKTSTKKS